MMIIVLLVVNNEEKKAGNIMETNKSDAQQLNDNLNDKELQLITPEVFKKEFAPVMGMASVRELFRREGFPSIKSGNRYFTTRRAARMWLSSMGKDI
jgi:hypothetical protein